MFGGLVPQERAPAGRSARTTIATTFYPGTTDQAAAQPIAVAAGAEVGNISFAVQSLPAFRVSGVVVDEDGHPAAGAMVSLTGDPRDGAMFMGPAGMMRTQDDGRFQIDDVVPGRYRAHASILVMYNSSGGATAGVSGGVSAGASGGAVVSGSSGAVATWSSNDSSSGTMDQPIEVVVTDADVSGVRIVARRPVRQ
jgi:hypothetical protein